MNDNVVRFCPDCGTYTQWKPSCGGEEVCGAKGNRVFSFLCGTYWCNFPSGLVCVSDDGIICGGINYYRTRFEALQRAMYVECYMGRFDLSAWANTFPRQSDALVVKTHDSVKDALHLLPPLVDIVLGYYM